MHGYRENFKTWGRDKLALVSAIPMPANKRNYLTQREHLEIARGIRDIRMKQKGKSDWREGNGRPIGSGTKEEQIRTWRLANPNGKKIDCHRATGITRPTIDKWWNN